MPFDLNKEKMLCLMALDDGLASKLSVAAGEAYWRGFILEDRVTHKISALFRYSYEDGRKFWYRIPARHEDTAKAVEDLQVALSSVLKIGLVMMGFGDDEVRHAIESYYPPDDEGDGMKTVLWLDQQGLVEFV